MPRFHWLVVQEGQLPLRPDRHFAAFEHRPTVTLIWREGTAPNRENSLLVDPYFTPSGFQGAVETLRTKGISFAEIGTYFVTHQHYDHMLRLPIDSLHLPFQAVTEAPESIRAVSCPGHDADLRALAFTSTDDKRVWVVSDAVLDEEWLRAWGYYYPNQYSPEEIMQTWRSIGAIFADADVIIPGHGAPIQVNRTLVEALIADFSKAEYAKECPDVLEALRERLANLP